MRTTTSLMLGVSALAIAGCTTLPGSSVGGTFTAQNYLRTDHNGSADFNGTLASEYTLLARRAAYDDEFWMNSTAYIAKARQAEAGNTPAPWTPAELGVGGEADAMYNDVVARINANRDANPVTCAHAQAMWDQYLELLRAEAAGDPPRMTAQQARVLLDEAMTACAPASPTMANYVVYFDWDRSDLTAEARATLDEVAAAVQQRHVMALSVVGNTDTSGSVEYNQALSDRRARSVADNLASQGVPVGAMTLAGRSELDLAVQTGDNVRERLNRRVEITLSQ